MLSGLLPVLPEDSADYFSWRAAHTAAIKPDIREYRSQVPPRIANLLNACLCANPSERPSDFQTISEVLETSDIVEEPAEASADTLDVSDMTRGFSLLKLGRLEEAVACADHIVRVAYADRDSDLDVFLAKGHALRAEALRMMGKYPEAVHAADAALAVDPNDPLALFTRAGLYSRMGQYQLALRCLQKSQSFDPDRPGLALWRITRKWRMNTTAVPG